MPSSNQRHSHPAVNVSGLYHILCWICPCFVLVLQLNPLILQNFNVWQEYAFFFHLTPWLHMNNTKREDEKIQVYIQFGTTRFGFFKRLIYVFSVMLISYRKNFCLLKRGRKIGLNELFMHWYLSYTLCRLLENLKRNGTIVCIRKYTCFLVFVFLISCHPQLVIIIYMADIDILIKSSFF